MEEPQAVAAYAARAWPSDREGDSPLPSLDGPELIEGILSMSGKEYRRVLADSSLVRPSWNGMLRNLCVALENHRTTLVGSAERVRPLLERVMEDPSGLVREHAEWALGESDGFSRGVDASSTSSPSPVLPVGRIRDGPAVASVGDGCHDLIGP